MDPNKLADLPDRRVRHPVCLDARITRADGSVIDSLATDLSLNGCCVTGRFTIAEALTLQMPRIGTLAGQVRWSIGNRSGVRFIQPEPLR